MITPHYYRPNAANYGPTKHVIVDCESVPTARSTDKTEYHSLRLWCAERMTVKNGVVVHRYATDGMTQHEFWRWFVDELREDKSTWLWGHNVKVDATWLGIWHLIDSGELTIKPPYCFDNPFILFCSLQGRRFTVVDSTNWFRCKLADLGKVIGEAKGFMPSLQSQDSDWFAYCRQDVNILSETVENLASLVRGENLGMLRTTASSQSMASWRHIHKGVWPKVHGKAEVSKMERNAYIGGRCQVFWRGCVRSENPTETERQSFERLRGPTIWGSKVHVYDARGFYPSVMTGRKFPWKLSIRLDKPTLSDIERLSLSHGLIAECKLRTNRPCYPKRECGEVIYPTGCFWTTLAGPEIQQALLNRELVAVGQTLVYEMADLFTVWVEKMWGLRQRFRVEEKYAWEMTIKVLLNSLFGKFGQHSREWSDANGEKCHKRWGEWTEWSQKHGRFTYRRGIGGKVQIKEPEGEHNNAFVAIPAFVTSHARCLLQEWMEILPPRSLLYTDTDSLHVTDEGNKALQASRFVGKEGLGDLLKRSEHHYAEYLAPKMYRLDERIIAAGKPRESTDVEAWMWTYQEWSSVRQLICDGPTDLITVNKINGGSSDYARGSTDGQWGWVVPPERDWKYTPF